MRCRTLLVATLLLVMGCTELGKVPGASERSRSPDNGWAPPLQSAEPMGPPVDNGVPFLGSYKRLTFAPGQAIDQPGIFFMKVQTGAIEGLTLPGADRYEPSPDNRWVRAWVWAENQKTDTVYLFDRKAGAEFTWNAKERRLLAAQGDHLLFTDDNQVWLTDDELNTLTTIPAQSSLPSGVFSLDGERVAVANGPVVYLVPTAGGTPHKLAEFATDMVSHTSVGSSRGGAEIVVYAQLRGSADTDPRGFKVLRYSWQGQLVGEFTAPSSMRFTLSPDSRHLARTEFLVGVIHAAVISNTMESLDPGESGVRLKAAGFCDPSTGRNFGPTWLSDSSGVVVYTKDGYRILTKDGRILAPPAFAGQDVHEVIPAPDRPDRFALAGAKVIDSTGSVLSAAVLAPGATAGAIEPWGLASDELRFRIPAGGGGGGGCDFFALPAQLDRPPYTDQVTLKVGLQANDCVRLRQLPGVQAPVITCLSGDRRVTLTDPPPRIVEGKPQRVPTGSYADGMYWVHVMSDTGEEGWLAASAANLTWVG